MLHLLRRYRFALERFETKLNGNATLTDARMAEMLVLCEERIKPEWRRLWYRANALVEPILGDRRLLDAYKQLTELVLTPEFSLGPIWQRSHRKPLGYPGDYQIMKMVYSWQRQGDTPFAKLMHYLGLDALECVARSEEHTSELQSLMRISYAVFCLKNKNNTNIIKNQ